MSEIKLTITGMDPAELFSTIKGCAALLVDDVPTAVPEEKTQAPNPHTDNPTPAPAVTSVDTASPGASSTQGIQGPAPTHTPPVGQTAPVTQPSVPTQTAAATSPSPTAVPTAMPAVPTTSAPAYTLDQLSRAGADLITAHPDLMDKLNAIMASYGVQTIVQLPKERYGELALKLRELGAKI